MRHLGHFEFVDGFGKRVKVVASLDESKLYNAVRHATNKARSDGKQVRRMACGLVKVEIVDDEAKR